MARRALEPAGSEAAARYGDGMNFLGIEWVGVNAESGRKLLPSILFIGAA